MRFYFLGVLYVYKCTYIIENNDLIGFYKCNELNILFNVLLHFNQYNYLVNQLNTYTIV